MNTVTIAKAVDQLPGEVRVGGFNFTDDLNTDETITGTPTVSVSQVAGATDTDGITVSSVSATVAATTIDGETVATGAGVVFTVTCASDAVAGSAYQLLVTAVTTEGQTLKERVRVNVI